MSDSSRLFTVAACALLATSLIAAPARSGPEEEAAKVTDSDPSWVLAHEETFDFEGVLVDQQTFGAGGWLTARLRGEGAKIEVRDGAALLQTPEFSDSALLRLTRSLPSEYKLRVQIGHVDYDLSNYERVDLMKPGFKYKSPKKVENGLYWLALTDRRIQDGSGEEFWHRYRKVVIDSDDHVGAPRPVYMVYMNPNPHPNYHRERETPLWIDGVPGLLRCWSGEAWNKGAWNWDAAFQYEDDRWYSVEIEKADGHVVMRAMNAEGEILPGLETTPVAVDEIYGMGASATEEEWAYVGEPNVDSYEGEAQVGSIKLWVRGTGRQEPADE